MIAAIGANHELGKDNDLVWHLPDDFKRFKSLTTGHNIIMGRKTFESFPKLLPNRRHIVITRNRAYQVPPEVIVVQNMDEALAYCQEDPQPLLLGVVKSIVWVWIMRIAWNSPMWKVNLIAIHFFLK